MPESNEVIDQCCNWYYSVLEAREIDYMSGMIKKLTWNDVKSLVEYKPTTLPLRVLAAIAFVIDETYLSTIAKQREDAKQ